MSAQTASAGPNDKFLDRYNYPAYNIIVGDLLLAKGAWASIAGSGDSVIR